jgi:hypothetical protein
MTSDGALESLDEVPWAEVKGQAIPSLLRGVVAGEPDALGRLQEKVVAGGVIWEGSSYAVSPTAGRSTKTSAPTSTTVQQSVPSPGRPRDHDPRREVLS